MMGKLVDVSDVDREPSPFTVQHGIPAASERTAAALLGPVDSRHDLLLETVRDGAWKDRAMDETRGHDADPDLLDAQHGRVEDVAGGEDARKPDDTRGVASEQKDVGSRSPIEGADVDAKPEPQRQNEAEDERLIDEGGKERDRRGCPEKCANHAKERLRDHRARQRLRNEIGGRDRPHRLSKPDTQRNVIRDDRGSEALDRKENRFRISYDDLHILRSRVSVSNFGVPQVPRERPFRL